jgi:hypothetical protein
MTTLTKAAAAYPPFPLLTSPFVSYSETKGEVTVGVALISPART